MNGIVSSVFAIVLPMQDSGLVGTSPEEQKFTDVSCDEHTLFLHDTETEKCGIQFVSNAVSRFGTTCHGDIILTTKQK